MEKEGFDSSKLHVIYNSLSYKQQLKIRKQHRRFKISNYSVVRETSKKGREFDSSVLQ